MLEKDNSMSAIQAMVSAVKSSVRLDDSNQGQPDDGHASAPYGNGPDVSAAKPGGAVGTGY